MVGELLSVLQRAASIHPQTMPWPFCQAPAATGCVHGSTWILPLHRPGLSSEMSKQDGKIRKLIPELCPSHFYSLHPGHFIHTTVYSSSGASCWLYPQ